MDRAGSVPLALASAGPALEGHSMGLEDTWPIDDVPGWPNDARHGV